MNKGKGSWATFLLAFGFFLIAISPFSSRKYLTIVAGVALAGLGYFLTRKK
ncbi:hypothetical protein [Streptococcus minor]|uniref:hypothetical protein n=1 Tax=Streptococcus minor TaxID=229549 RepID=UPI00039B2E5A|nr:hypothetical protein [Streptococcus minor]